MKERIGAVEQMKDVVSVTEGLFEISKVCLRSFILLQSYLKHSRFLKETAQLESDIFVQRQKVALASEVKAVLDSWVRFEQSQKESEQAELAKTIIDKVLKSLSDEKTQREILANAVAEVERKYKYFLDGIRSS